MKYVDYEMLEQRDYLKQKEIVVYGAGEFGRKSIKKLNELGFFCLSICDSSPLKWEKKIDGYEIITPKDIMDKNNVLIILASNQTLFIEGMENIICTLERIQREKNSDFEEYEVASYFSLECLWRYSLLGKSAAVAIESQYRWGNTDLYSIRDIAQAGDADILVYQAAKVASTSIQTGLEKLGIRSAHIHHFMKQSQERCSPLYELTMDPLICMGEEYRNYLKNTFKNKKIITLVRDPVARDFSQFFQLLYSRSEIFDKFIAQKYQQNYSFSEIIVQQTMKYKNVLFEWFDRELKEVFGIDIYAHPFDKEQGYTIIRENNVEVLCLKAEKLSNLTDVIRNFIGNDKFELYNENIGDNKAYKQIYIKAKEKITFPQDYVDFYYRGNERMDHFYSEEEKNKFRNVWVKNE